MWQSIPIQVDGSLVGAAVRQQNGVRFIAIDIRAAEMDQTLWPQTVDVLRAAEQLVRTGRIWNFTPQSVED
jgi:thiazole synthase ThiGH ThiG subunit